MPVNPISEAAWHANGDVKENYVGTFDWTQPWHPNRVTMLIGSGGIIRLSAARATR
jgi:hypothetical protein